MSMAIRKQTDPFAQLPKLAERLGVREHGPDDPPTVVLRTEAGQAYDLFALVNAALDRFDVARQS
jgi:hypothetical protein